MTEMSLSSLWPNIIMVGLFANLNFGVKRSRGFNQEEPGNLICACMGRPGNLIMFLSCTELSFQAGRIGQVSGSCQRRVSCHWESRVVGPSVGGDFTGIKTRVKVTSVPSCTAVLTLLELSSWAVSVGLVAHNDASS